MFFFTGRCDPTRRPNGQVSLGGSFGCLGVNCAASLQLGGAHFERVSLSQLEGGGVGVRRRAPPEKFKI